MSFSFSSDDEDSYLGTNKFVNLQAKFNNFYKTRKLDESNKEDADYLQARTLSAVAGERTSRRRKAVSNDLLSSSSDDDASPDLIPCVSTANSRTFVTSQSKTAPSVIVDLNDVKKSVDTDDVLRQLDQLAQTAKELSEDYNAALYGKARSKSKKRKIFDDVVPPLILAGGSRGGSRSRVTRNSARLQRLQQQSSSNKSFNQPIIHLDSDSDSNNSVKLIEKLDLNPRVQCNINWRCDSEITHKLTMFKFQSLSCIQDFCSKNYNIDNKLILFTIDDKPVDLTQHCYASLKLTETSVIDGGVLPESYLYVDKPKVSKEVGLIRLRVQYEVQSKTKDFIIHVKKTDQFDVVFWLIIKELDCELKDILLYCDGSPVKIHDTVSSLDLEEDDCLDLTLIL